VYSRRLDGDGHVILFGDGLAPGPVDDHAEVRDLDVRTYYVANHSVGRRDWPALRVKSLTESGGAVQFRDEEVLPGVEDLQVEFAVFDEGTGATAHLLAPTLDSLRAGRIVAIRVWLRIRADRTESGFIDTRPLHYADVSYEPSGTEARLRRVVVERTVALRNLRDP
jgi:hypothetical protein